MESRDAFYRYAIRKYTSSELRHSARTTTVDFVGIFFAWAFLRKSFALVDSAWRLCILKGGLAVSGSEWRLVYDVWCSFIYFIFSRRNCSGQKKKKKPQWIMLYFNIVSHYNWGCSVFIVKSWKHILQIISQDIFWEVGGGESFDSLIVCHQKTRPCVLIFIALPWERCWNQSYAAKKTQNKTKRTHFNSCLFFSSSSLAATRQHRQPIFKWNSTE